MTAPRILVIAGSDSGGGAGIQADIKTITMLGGFAMTAITAVTAQNSLGVSAVMPVPADLVLAQIDAVIDDLGVDVVKIGMIGTSETAAAVARRLEGLAETPVVFDPVMVATSGAELADEAAIATFERLIAVATLVTPNVPELAALTGNQLRDLAQVETAARKLAQDRGVAVLAKGGHLEGPMITDLLVTADGTVTRWAGERIETPHTHGTGCTLASAIATGIGKGLSLPDAVSEGREFVRRAILAAPGFGRGHGPMGHWAAASG